MPALELVIIDENAAIEGLERNIIVDTSAVYFRAHEQPNHAKMYFVKDSRIVGGEIEHGEFVKINTAYQDLVSLVHEAESRRLKLDDVKIQGNKVTGKLIPY